jgi:polysaccharide biosynthesis/export protein
MLVNLAFFLYGRLKAAVAGGLLLLLFANTAAADEYVLAKGDILEFQVLGIPDLRQRAPIGLDGTVLLPLVGVVQAAGRTVSSVRDTIAEQAARKSYPVNGGGGDVWHFVHPEAVVLQVLEHRPIYLNGDVAKPGEQPFRSGMTVRQAIAVAGGYDLARLQMENPILQLTDLKTSHNTLWTRLAAAQIRVARLEAELEDRDEIDSSDLAGAPLPSNMLPAVERLESELFANRVSDHSKEKQAIGVALQHTERRLNLLSERQQNEQTATEEDTLEYERVKKLFEEKLIPITRVNEARRNVLLWSTRTLETFAEAARMERERNDLERNLVSTRDSRQIELLTELRDVMLEIADLEFQLQGNAQKLVYVGALRSELARGGGQSPPEITIVRKVADRVNRISTDEDADLWPGDVVEVKLKIEWLLSASPKSSTTAEQIR